MINSENHFDSNKIFHQYPFSYEYDFGYQILKFLIPYLINGSHRK